MEFLCPWPELCACYICSYWCDRELNCFQVEIHSHLVLGAGFVPVEWCMFNWVKVNCRKMWPTDAFSYSFSLKKHFPFSGGCPAGWGEEHYGPGPSSAPGGPRDGGRVHDLRQPLGGPQDPGSFPQPGPSKASPTTTTGALQAAGGHCKGQRFHRWHQVMFSIETEEMHVVVHVQTHKCVNLKCLITRGHTEVSHEQSDKKKTFSFISGWGWSQICFQAKD